MEYPKQFIINIVLETLSCKDEKDFTALIEKYNTYSFAKDSSKKITREKLSTWRKKYLKTAVVALEYFRKSGDVGDTENVENEDVEFFHKTYISKSQLLFSDESDYCRSFKESSFVTDDLKEKTNENLILDYEGLNYVRYMKRFNPKHLRDFPKGIFSEKLPIEANIEDALQKPFHLRFYLPKNIVTYKGNTVYKSKKRIVVMLNGMNEDLRYDIYDILGEYFANNGMMAVLLPTPLNLNRRLHKDYKTIKEVFKENKPTGKMALLRTSPTDWAAQDQMLFYKSFLKSFDELNELVDNINPTKKDDDFFEKWGNTIDGKVDKAFYKRHFWKDEKKLEETEIILLGYSLGGLKAFSYFIYSPLKYRCCITLNSGPNLLEANTNPLGVTGWEEMLITAKDLVQNIKQVQNWENSDFLLQHDENGEIIYDTVSGAKQLREIFQTLYFGFDNSRVKDEIRKEGNHIINRYLAINSSADQIVNQAQLKHIAPDGKHINQLIVPDVDHHLVLDQNWQEVLPKVEDDIYRFINSCIHEHYKRDEIAKDVAAILEGLETFKIAFSEYVLFKLEYKKSFTKSDFDALLIEISNSYSSEGSKKIDEFLNLYYASKGFFLNFSELYNKILRDVAKRKT